MRPKTPLCEYCLKPPVHLLTRFVRICNRFAARMPHMSQQGVSVLLVLEALCRVQQCGLHTEQHMTIPAQVAPKSSKASSYTDFSASQVSHVSSYTHDKGRTEA